MTPARVTIAVILLALLGVILLRSGRNTPEPGNTPGAKTEGQARSFHNSASCAECHPAVTAEWKQSMHAQAWHDPLVRAPEMSDDFRRKDCIPCHAPRPVFEHGIGQGARVVPRLVNMHEGVDCLACHRIRGPSGEAGVATTREGLRAACNPVLTRELADVALCAPCHDQHKTITGEWALAPEDLKGANCNECHMPEVTRPPLGGLPARKGRSHRFFGGHDPEFVTSAITLSHEITRTDHGRELAVSLSNTGAGHHVPTDARHRALDLVVTLFDERDREILANEERPPGQENGTRRLRLRNPYRTETGEVDSRLPAGETVFLRVPLAPGLARARIRLVYKLTPYIGDEEGQTLIDRTLDLNP